VNSREDSEYRLRLARGFLHEARHNFEHALWRSCVDNSQLTVENCAKTVIAIFEPVEKTHDPSHQIKKLISRRPGDPELTQMLEDLVPMAEKFSSEKHFMTDYGDEVTKTDPWTLFGKQEAREALDMAEKAFQISESVFRSHSQGG
jgi:HEPN domain-containing protein